MSCRGFAFCGMCDDCPFDDQCNGNAPNAHGYIDGMLATKTPKEPVNTWEEEGGRVVWPVYDEARGG